MKRSIRDIENKYKKWPPRHTIENYITRQASIPYQKFLASSKQAFRLLNQIQHENFYRVYPHKAFCNNIILSKCVFSDGSKLFVVIIIIRHHMVLGSYMKKYLLWLRSWNIKSKQVFVSVFKNNSNCPNSLVFVHPWVS